MCTLGCFSGNRLSARQGKTYIQISYIQVINTEKSMLKSSLFYFFFKKPDLTLAADISLRRYTVDIL